MNLADEVISLFERRGSAAYFGERISMTEHALQAAHYGSLVKASPQLVLAALLHDIGHLIEVVPDNLNDWVSDARHEESGARWLAQYFGPDISEPVRLHVRAKRYLCAKDPNYVAMLSQASVITLQLQGGAMSKDECLQFETETYYREAVQLRLWDDQGKVSGLKTASLTEYRELIQQYALRDPRPG